MKRLVCAMAAVLSAIAPLASAQDAVGTKPKKALVLLQPGEIDPARILPPPPPEGSERAIEDLRLVQAAIAAASPERMATARWDDAHESPQMLEPVLGQAFDLKALPATAELLSLVQMDADVEASIAKKMFQRRRPWAVDGAVKTCDPNDKPLSSYPSGHGALGYALALTMAEVLPERAQALLARAADYGYSREVCGSHFPDDVQASEALATAVVGRLMTKPAFQQKIAAARTELEAHGFGPAAR